MGNLRSLDQSGEPLVTLNVDLPTMEGADVFSAAAAYVKANRVREAYLDALWIKAARDRMVADGELVLGSAGVYRPRSGAES